MEISIAAVAVVLGVGGLLAGGLLASRLRSGASLAQTFAGGLMLALVTVDLLPDALTDGRSAGWSSSQVMAVFALVAAPTYLLLRPRTNSSDHGRCCSGTFSSAGIALHGAIEGMVLGLGLGLDSAAGPVLLCAFCLHKFGEGFALRVSLRSADSGRRQVRTWMALAALAPVLGAIVGSMISLSDRLVPLLTAALAAVLTVVALVMLSPLGRTTVSRSPLGRIAAPVLAAGLLRNWVSLAAGVTLMGIVTGLVG